MVGFLFSMWTSSMLQNNENQKIFNNHYEKNSRKTENKKSIIYENIIVYLKFGMILRKIRELVLLVGLYEKIEVVGRGKVKSMGGTVADREESYLWPTECCRCFCKG